MNSISLHTLPKVTMRSKKRVGRGYGSGKGGHTSGRGQKGQKSRRTIPWSFEGGALPLSQRLPFWRGKGRLNPLKPKPAPVNIGGLERFPDGTVIDLAFLVKERIIHQSDADTRGVKILGDGKLTKKLTVVGMRMSGSAREAIEKAGGAVSESQQHALHSRGLRPRARLQTPGALATGGQVVVSQPRDSGAPADFSFEKNQGPSEKNKNIVVSKKSMKPRRPETVSKSKMETTLKKTKKRVVRTSKGALKPKIAPKKKAPKKSKTK